MGRASRGNIEEGSVAFSHEAEKTIVFQAASVNNRNFPLPPVVKLISASRYPSDLLSNQRYLLFDAAGNYRPDDQYNATTVADEAAFKAGVTETIHNPIVDPNYSPTLNAPSNHVGKAAALLHNEIFTIPFNRSRHTHAKLIQLFFKIKFTNFNDGGDSLDVYFVNRETIDAPTPDGSPTSFNQLNKHIYKVYYASPGRDKIWKPFPGSGAASGNSGRERFTITGGNLVATELAGAAAAGEYIQLRIDITEVQPAIPALGFASKKLSDLGGFAFKAFDTHSTVTLSFADVFVFAWENNTDNWPRGGLNLLGHNVSETTQSNVHVSFTNVTSRGMKILTSAPFTGVIRYLCSVQG